VAGFAWAICRVSHRDIGCRGTCTCLGMVPPLAALGMRKTQALNCRYAWLHDAGFRSRCQFTSLGRSLFYHGCFRFLGSAEHSVTSIETTCCCQSLLDFYYLQDTRYGDANERSELSIYDYLPRMRTRCRRDDADGCMSVVL